MNGEIIDMLIYKDTDGLCNSFGLLPFQVDVLEKYYKHIGSKVIRDELVKKIGNGFYSTEEKKNEMAKFYLSKCITLSSDNGKSLIIEKCGFSDVDAQKVIDDYNRINNYIKDMLSTELDVSNLNMQMEDVLESISKPFLDSQRGKTL